MGGNEAVKLMPPLDVETEQKWKSNSVEPVFESMRKIAQDEKVRAYLAYDSESADLVSILLCDCHYRRRPSNVVDGISISLMWTKIGFRGRGITTILIAAALNHLKGEEEMALPVTVSSSLRSSNPTPFSSRLYRHLGFRWTKTSYSTCLSKLCPVLEEKVPGLGWAKVETDCLPPGLVCEYRKEQPPTEQAASAAPAAAAAAAAPSASRDPPPVQRTPASLQRTALVPAMPPAVSPPAPQRRPVPLPVGASSRESRKSGRTVTPTKKASASGGGEGQSISHKLRAIMAHGRKKAQVKKDLKIERRKGKDEYKSQLRNMTNRAVVAEKQVKAKDKRISELELEMQRIKAQAEAHQISAAKTKLDCGKDVAASNLRAELYLEQVGAANADTSSAVQHPFMVLFESALQGSRETRNKHRRTKARHVLDMLWDGSVLGEEGRLETQDFVWAKARLLFPPDEVAKQKDLAPVGASLQAYDVIRKSQVGLMKAGEGVQAKYSQGVLPSVSAIQRIQKEVEDIAEGLVPRKLMKTPNGNDIIAFDTEALIRHLVNRYGLEEKAKAGSITIAISMDGSDYADGRNDVLVGFKMVDEDVQDPNTGELLFSYHADGDDVEANATVDEDGKLWKKVQSRDLVYPILLIDEKETDGVYQYDVMKELFDFARKLSTEGLPDGGEGKPRLQKMNAIFTGDLATQFRLASRGSGARSRVDNDVCPLCSAKSNQIAQYFIGSNKCEQCDDAPECRHWPIESAAFVDKLREELRRASGMQFVPFEEVLAWRHVEEIVVAGPGGEFLYDPCLAAKATMVNHIEFELQDCSSDAKKREHNQLVERALMARGHSRAYCRENNLESKREVLRKSLEDGHRIKRIRWAITEYDRLSENGKRKVPLDKLVMCLLHCENRMSEKIITMLLVEGMSGHGTENVSKSYIEEVEKIVNDQDGVLGGMFYKTSWKVPVDGNKIKPVSLKNRRARKFLANVEKLYPLCLKHCNEERAKDWKDAIYFYREMIAALNERRNFDKEAAWKLQREKIDPFCDVWDRLHGYEGKTNYFHFLVSGHAAEQLANVGNLYRFSQEGFEAFNSLKKSVYHKQTAMGGGRAKVRSHLLPVGRYLSRLLAWRFGDADRHFEKKKQGGDRWIVPGGR